MKDIWNMEKAADGGKTELQKMRGCEELKTGADVKIPSPRG
jgi:hypothetical protein